jgi:hypothetical protein
MAQELASGMIVGSWAGPERNRSRTPPIGKAQKLHGSKGTLGMDVDAGSKADLINRTDPSVCEAMELGAAVPPS